MNIGNFYYIVDEYFDRFQDPYLMKNKEIVNEQSHDRPFYYAFKSSDEYFS